MDTKTSFETGTCSEHGFTKKQIGGPGNQDGVDVTNLYDDVKDGVLLNKVLDHIKPGSVNWKMICLTKITALDS